MTKIKASAIFLCLFVVGLDQLAKALAIKLVDVHYNPGVFLGLLSYADKFLRIVALSSAGLLLFSLYIFMVILLPGKMRSILLGASLVMGGILGNLVDKVTIGRSVDYIPFSLMSFQAYFNLADVFLWIGSFIILWTLFKKDPMVWNSKWKKRRILYRPRQQLSLAFKFMAVSLCFSIVTGAFSYILLKNMGGSGREILQTYLLSFLLISIVFNFLTFFAGLFLSLKIIGPVYAFEKYIEALLRGEDRGFKTRDGDSFKELEGIADQLRERIRK